MVGHRIFIACISALLVSTTRCQSAHLSKRGLASVSNAHSTEDQRIWTANNSDISWYYNWGANPDSAFSSLEFVPMLFSAPDEGDTSFADAVKSQIDFITAILAFNEPDGPTSSGGTSMAPSIAASSYISDILPLRSQYNTLRVGLPAVTGSQRGIDWLQNFNTSCQALNPGHGCPADFIPLHWYGDFQGIASWIGQIRAFYPTLPIWVTEFADPGQSLSDTQSSFNETLEYLDRLDYVERYAYFGSFRAENSGVGDNVAMLDNGGELTDIGAEYLEEPLTGNMPVDGSGVGRLKTGDCWMLGLVLGCFLFGYLA